MRALVALLLALLLAAVISACDATGGEGACDLPADVAPGQVALCLRGAVDLEVRAAVDATLVDQNGGSLVLDIRGTREAGGFVILQTGPDPAPGVYQIWAVPPDGQFVGALVLTVDVPDAFDTFAGVSGTVTVESIGADGAVAGRIDVRGEAGLGALRIEGRFRTP